MKFMYMHICVDNSGSLIVYSPFARHVKRIELEDEIKGHQK